MNPYAYDISSAVAVHNTLSPSVGSALVLFNESEIMTTRSGYTETPTPLSMGI